MDPDDRRMLVQTDGLLDRLEALRLADQRRLRDDEVVMIDCLLRALGRKDRMPKTTRAAIDLVFRIQENWLPPEPPRRQVQHPPRCAQVLHT